MTTDDIKALVERLRDGTNTSWEQTFLDCHEAADALETLLQDIEDLKHDNASMLDSLTKESVARCEAEDALAAITLENQRLRLEFRADCEKQAEELFAIGRKLEIATQELRNIANADTVEWDDPTQYEDWAKSRARWALGKIGGQS